MTSLLRNTSAAFVLVVACAAPAETFAQCASAPASLGPRFADAAQFRTAAQGIVDSFAAGVSRARGGALADAPIAEVRNTPQLISFLSSSNTVVVPWWETQPPEMRAVFRTFAGGGDAQAERFFRAFFNRFLIAHEAAHWFQARANRREPTLYANDNAATRLAVAFWRAQPDGECFLAELERLATQAATRLPDPTPAGESPAAYFDANYQTLGRDPLKYGYYQFRFMAEALRDRAQLDFARIVSATSAQEPAIPTGRLVFRASSLEFRPDGTFALTSVLDGFGEVQVTGTWTQASGRVALSAFKVVSGLEMLQAVSVPFEGCETSGQYRFEVS